jgi:hypothetical protein
LLRGIRDGGQPANLRISSFARRRKICDADPAGNSAVEAAINRTTVRSQQRAVDFRHAEPLTHVRLVLDDVRLVLDGFRRVRPTELSRRMRIIDSSEKPQRRRRGAENHNICFSHLVTMDYQVSDVVFRDRCLGDYTSLIFQFDHP